MGSSAPLGRLSWYYCLAATKKIQGINPIGINASWADSFEMISLRIVIKIARDKPNGT